MQPLSQRSDAPVPCAATRSRSPCPRRHSGTDARPRKTHHRVARSGAQLPFSFAESRATSNLTVTGSVKHPV